ncbi:DUF1801 domain-containing protein [Planktotalea sp.]|uniref:DUF1801 domain-containing protein n=1 Tax=Planktotalea sp. TaxID=2029877 RepID=UPI003F6AA0BE
MPPIPSPVSAAYERFETAQRDTLLKARALIFEVAREDKNIGELEEVLRWGEPAYITSKKKTGSTIRLAVEKQSGQPAIFFNCQTTLVGDMRSRFGTELTYSKNRAILLASLDDTIKSALKFAIGAALTYHLRN